MGCRGRIEVHADSCSPFVSSIRPCVGICIPYFGCCTPCVVSCNNYTGCCRFYVGACGKTLKMASLRSASLSSARKNYKCTSSNKNGFAIFLSDVVIGSKDCESEVVADAWIVAVLEWVVAVFIWALTATIQEVLVIT